eukprot:g375.t1
MTSRPVIVEAPSGKSKCKACRYLGTDDPTIERGTLRVGIPGVAAGGITVMHWVKPKCFAKHCITVDRAPTGRAKCKADGSAIVKGSIRLRLGYKKNCTLFKLANAESTILPQLRALVGVGDFAIHGLDELTPEEQSQATAAILSGRTEKVAAATAAAQTTETKRESRKATSRSAASSKKKKLVQQKRKRDQPQQAEDVAETPARASKKTSRKARKSDE